MNLKIERDIGHHLTIMVVAALGMLIGLALYFSKGLVVGGIIVICVFALLFLLTTIAMLKVFKQCIDVTDTEITAKMLNGNTKVVSIKDIKTIMYTSKRLTNELTINRNYLFVELRGENGESLMKITRQSFNQLKILQMVEHLEKGGIEIVDE